MMASKRSRTVGWACVVLGLVGMLGCRPTLEPRVPHEDPADPSAPSSAYRPSPNVFEGSAFDGESLDEGGHGGHAGHGGHGGHGGHAAHQGPADHLDGALHGEHSNDAAEPGRGDHTAHSHDGDGGRS